MLQFKLLYSGFVIYLQDWEKSNGDISHFGVKGAWPDHFWIHPSKWSFWYQMKAPIFLITPVKYNMQQMLILKKLISKM